MFRLVANHFQFGSDAFYFKHADATCISYQKGRDREHLNVTAA